MSAPSTLQAGAAAPRAGGTTRLMITKMILENFKSYAGVQEIGPFHKRFSSIVGPNGSGKSNVIDALLFIFGKKAKQLRLNKVSELIHKSSRYPNLESCSVEVHFQLIVDDEEHPDDFVVVAGSEFSVSRTVTSNNGSDYTLNGRKKAYKEIEELLKGHGIDLDNNRFLILQGEVEQIAMMKPKSAAPGGEDGMLEYLEDIIGSNRFVAQIDTVSKELDVLNEQRTDKVNRLKIAERERDSLSGSKGEAEVFLEKEREIRRKKNTLYQVYEYTSARQVQELNDRRKVAAEKLAYEQGKKSESDAKLKTMEKTYAKTLADYKKVEEDVKTAADEFAAYERRDVKLQTDMAFQRANLKKAQEAERKDAEKEDKHTKDADTNLAQLESSRRKLEEAQARKIEEEKAVDEIMSGLQEATKGEREKQEAANIALIEAERAVSGLMLEKDSVDTQIKLIQSRSELAAASLKQSEDKLTQLAANLTAGRKRKQEAEAEKTRLAGVLRELEAVALDCESEETKMQSDLRTAVANCEEVKASAAQSSNVGNKAIQAIMKASKKGGALASAGVRGRLGDLATIDSEHDVAITTACGMLDNVLVDTTAGAEACIRYLKQHSLGRLTFIAADQQGAARDKMDQPFTAPAGSQRLFDLVRPLDPAFRPALYRALGDCLVARDLPTATRIGLGDPKNRRRVVTLEGGMVEPMGSISGGGQTNKRGGMSITGSGKSVTAVATDEEFTPQQVAALEAKVKEIQANLDAVRQAGADAEKEMKDTQAQIKALTTEVEKLVLSLARMAEQEVENRERIAELTPETRLSREEEAALAGYKQRLSAIEAEMHKASPNLSSLKAEIARMQRKINEIGGPALKSAQDRLDKTSAVIEQISSLLSTKTVEESTARKAAAKASQARAKSKAQATEAEEKLAKIAAEQKDMESDAEKVVTAVEEAKAHMASQEEELHSIKAEFEEIQRTVAKIRSVEMDLKLEMEEAGRKLKETEAVLVHWSKEVTAVQKIHLEDQREFNATVKAIMLDKASVLPASAGTPVEGEQSTEPQEDVLPTLSEDRLKAAEGDLEEIKYELHVLEQERERLKEKVDMSALLEYMKKDAFYRSRLAELEIITEQRNASRRTYEDLRRQRLEEFMGGFGAITLKLKEMYQMITLGGDAELELVDSLDPFSEGIVFSVRPPKKSWKNISNLSGGEKTLSSLALVFALHHYKPTPLYVMDEIDAALDFKNVSIVANYIKERTKNAQFVIISLRNNMFELADRLVGIYKTNDATKSVTIDPRTFSPAVAGELVPSAAGKGKPERAVLGDATNKV